MREPQPAEFPVARHITVALVNREHHSGEIILYMSH